MHVCVLSLIWGASVKRLMFSPQLVKFHTAPDAGLCILDGVVGAYGISGEPLKPLPRFRGPILFELDSKRCLWEPCKIQNTC